MVDNFLTIQTVFGMGVNSIFGGLEIGALLLIFVVVAVLAFAGLDIVASIELGGLLALGLAYAGWLPLEITRIVVLVLWGLGFAYFWLIFYNR
jgi:hypothetical protein